MFIETSDTPADVALFKEGLPLTSPLTKNEFHSYKLNLLLNEKSARRLTKAMPAQKREARLAYLFDRRNLPVVCVHFHNASTETACYRGWLLLHDLTKNHDQSMGIWTNAALALLWYSTRDDRSKSSPHVHDCCFAFPSAHRPSDESTKRYTFPDGLLVSEPCATLRHC